MKCVPVNLSVHLFVCMTAYSVSFFEMTRHFYVEINLLSCLGETHHIKVKLFVCITAYSIYLFEMTRHLYTEINILYCVGGKKEEIK